GASDSLASSGTADIVVIPAAMPSFMITAGASKTVQAGQSASYNFTVTSVNGFTGAVSLSATNLPAGATASFSPASVTPTANGTASATLTIQTSVSTPAATTMPTIVGTSGALTKQAAETLNVTTVVSSGSPIYVSEIGNNRIVRMNDITGAGWTTFGSLGSGVGQFNMPSGIFVAPDNRIYIADTQNNRIVRIDDITGAGWTTFGVPGNGVDQFREPFDIRVDSQNRIYIADRDNGRVVRINDMTGAGWVSFGSLGSGTGQFGIISGIFVDSANRIYIADTGHSQIARIDDMTGANLITLGGALIDSPLSVFVDSSNRIYSSNYFSPRERVVRVDDMSGANPAFFNVLAPGRLFVDALGKIYLPIADNKIIRIDDITGAGLVSLGTTGSGTNQFRGPFGLFVR
ncbi:MAG TPA: hypothetical protein VFJ58_09945, partial [Armatimonadota bacterium]|nr:hypothetical protein [Armatimonadota bacterium]